MLFRGEAEVVPTGQGATYQLGTLTVSGKGNFTLTGLESTFALGNITTSADSNVTLTSLVAEFETGTLVATGDNGTTLVGVQSTWHVNPEQYPLWAWTKETGGSTTETWTRELGRAA